MTNRFYIRMKTWRQARSGHAGDEAQATLDKLESSHDREENLAVYAAGIACVAQPSENGPSGQSNHS